MDGAHSGCSTQRQFCRDSFTKKACDDVDAENEKAGCACGRCKKKIPIPTLPQRMVSYIYILERGVGWV